MNQMVYMLTGLSLCGAAFAFIMGMFSLYDFRYHSGLSQRPWELMRAEHHKLADEDMDRSLVMCFIFVASVVSFIKCLEYLSCHSLG